MNLGARFGVWWVAHLMVGVAANIYKPSVYWARLNVHADIATGLNIGLKQIGWRNCVISWFGQKAKSVDVLMRVER